MTKVKARLWCGDHSLERPGAYAQRIGEAFNEYFSHHPEQYKKLKEEERDER